MEGKFYKSPKRLTLYKETEPASPGTSSNDSHEKVLTEDDFALHFLSQPGGLEKLARELPKFTSLSAAVLDRIFDESRIENGRDGVIAVMDAVAENPEIFDIERRATITDKLRSAGMHVSIMRNSKKYPHIDYNELIQEAINEYNNPYGLTDAIRFMSYLNNDTALLLIKTGYQGMGAVSCYPDSFNELSRDVFDTLLEKYNFNLNLFSYPDKFRLVNQLYMVDKAIEHDRSYAVCDAIEEYDHDLHLEIATRFINSGNGEYVRDHLEGFNEKDHEEILAMLSKKGIHID